MTYRPADWDLGQGKKIFKSGLECRADGWMWQQKDQALVIFLQAL